MSKLDIIEFEEIFTSFSFFLQVLTNFQCNPTVKSLSKFALKPEIPNNSIKDIKIPNNLRRSESIIIITKADKGNTLVVIK